MTMTTNQRNTLNAHTLDLIGNVQRIIQLPNIEERDTEILYDVLHELAYLSGSLEDCLRCFDKWGYILDGMEKRYNDLSDLPCTPTTQIAEL
ncbi:MAG: hypothetical protein NC548_36840 [Lachnospiraceae bacterium]|nr:hypothetical protein [Lachnospiraceae bacterium]